MQFQGFRPLRMLNGSTNLPSVDPHIITNSAVVTEGDAMKIQAVASTAEAADAITDVVYGFCMGFVVQAGKFNLPLASVSGNSTYVDGTYSGAATGDTYTAASDNLTDKKVAALIMPKDGLVLSAYLDAAAGTTTGSNLPNYHLDILTSDSTQLDESSAATTASSTIFTDYVTMPDPGNPASALDSTDKGGRRVLVRVDTEITAQA